MRVAGIMSGTSLDGIDVAILDADEEGFELLGFRTEAYPQEVRQALLGVSNREAHVGDVARLNFLLPELYAEAFQRCCQENSIAPESVAVIGCHGQTIFHQGEPQEYLGRPIACTLQIGDGSVLAARTGCKVVSDFRPRDMAAGGRGAPLVPYIDYRLFADDNVGRAVLNIGGIANLTLLPAGVDRDGVVAFDCGPGNMIIDALVAHYSNGEKRYDEGGAWAGEGEIDPDFLNELLDDDYYRLDPPKTAGREQYGEAVVERVLARGLKPEDALATVTMLTAVTIADAVYNFAPEESIREVIVSGGGVHNQTLMGLLQAELDEIELLASDELDIDADAKEAIVFALLAYDTVQGKPNNLPAATGAKEAVVMGKVSR